jgi:geranylgeranyl diphosphate synthase type II
MPVCCAIEMIHTYSLIHDDLPAMDDDDFRRGKPTCHKVFGEAMAILAGDALLTRAFQTLAQVSTDPLFIQKQGQLIAEIAAAAGTENGMIAGQVMDILAEGAPIDATTLDHLHRAKTGALITASVRAGGLLGDAGVTELRRLTSYAEAIGLAFQIVDDVLDLTATSGQLGKTPGKDVKVGKATFPALYGLEQSRQMAYQLVEAAMAETDQLNRDATRLQQLAHYMIERVS